LQAGQRGGDRKPTPGEEKRLRFYRGNLDMMLGINGPFDEPNTCLQLADVFSRGRNYRQAAQQLLRANYFNPDNLAVRFLLISLYTQLGLSDKALEMVAETRARPPGGPLTTDEEILLLQNEAWAYQGRNELGKAEQILRAAQKQHPNNSDVFLTLFEIYQRTGNMTNAVAVLDEQMRLQPENPQPLINYAAIKLRTGNAREAILPLDRALKLQPNNPLALFNRAIAHLQSGQLDEARRDYEAVRSLLTQRAYAVTWGLHEVAYRKKERKEAIRYGEEFVKIAPAGSPEITVIKERLKKLKKGSF